MLSGKWRSFCLGLNVLTGLNIAWVERAQWANHPSNTIRNNNKVIIITSYAEWMYDSHSTFQKIAPFTDTD